jgi:hypothetical protein
MTKKYDHSLIRVPISFSYDARSIIAEGRTILSREFRSKIATILLTKLQGKHNDFYPANTPYEQVTNFLFNAGFNEERYIEAVDNFEFCINVYPQNIIDHLSTTRYSLSEDSTVRTIQSVVFLSGILFSFEQSIDYFGEWDIPDVRFLENVADKFRLEFTANMRNSYIPPYDPEKAKSFLQNRPGRPDHR